MENTFWILMIFAYFIVYDVYKNAFWFRGKATMILAISAKALALNDIY